MGHQGAGLAGVGARALRGADPVARRARGGEDSGGVAPRLPQGEPRHLVRAGRTPRLQSLCRRAAHRVGPSLPLDSRARSRIAPLALHFAELLIAIPRRAHVARRLDELDGLHALHFARLAGLARGATKVGAWRLRLQLHQAERHRRRPWQPPLALDEAPKRRRLDERGRRQARPVRARRLAPPRARRGGAAERPLFDTRRHRFWRRRDGANRAAARRGVAHVARRRGRHGGLGALGDRPSPGSGSPPPSSPSPSSLGSTRASSPLGRRSCTAPALPPHCE
mmetsp:Transcript_17555/g.56116  ORF Transcript_17555/g.56116 Transcript_17555/m.56116 type:complete len:281 (-) Transcript_17555:264-1106(-)